MSSTDTDNEPVYIYQVILDSANGVSSIRNNAVVAISFQEGEIRQLQFVEDDTVMILWSSASTYLCEQYL